MRESLRLLIEGMHCGACVRRVTEVLQGVGGLQLKSVEVGSAEMTFNPQEATAENIVAAVNRIGFNAHIDK